MYKTYANTECKFMARLTDFHRQQRVDDFCDDERSLPRGRELVHVVGLLDASEDVVANIEGSFPNVAIMITK
jgi:hypothetical protein